MTPDWIEKKTAELLASAKRSGFFKDAIRDAKFFAEQGYAWDVALAMSCKYWCS
jgi:hypothetical protein